MKAPWYARTAPRGASAAVDTRLRANLARDRARLDTVVHRAFEETHAVLDARAGARDGARVLAAIITHAGTNAVDALNVAARARCGLDATREEAQGAWQEGAERAARAWMEGEAPGAAWEALIEGLLACEPTGMERAELGALARLARAGAHAVRALEETPRWARRTGLRNASRLALGAEPRRWAGEIVRAVAAEIGQAPLARADAEAALAHWRWPDQDPPLEMIAAGAGKLAPIRSDSAWANACATRAKVRWDRDGVQVRAARANEEKAIEEAKAKVREAARRAMWCPRDEGGRRMARAERAWRRSTALAGDGALGTPRLEPRAHEGRERMRWMLDVAGPETLSASAVWQGIGLEEALETYRTHASTLSMSIERSDTAVEVIHQERRRADDTAGEEAALETVAALLS